MQRSLILNIQISDQIWILQITSALTVALKIQETCGTYATDPLIITLASATGGSSPSIADISDVFPSPVLPTTATKLPTGISRLIFDSVGLSA